MFDGDPSKVDMSVVASLPVEVRMEVERELAMHRRRQRQQQQDATKPKEKEVTEKTNKKRKKKYWQAKETTDGEVEVLCFECRREPQKKRQQTLQCFATTATKKKDRKKTTDSDKAADSNDNTAFCARCRVPLHQQRRSGIPTNKVVSVLPQVTRLKGYKRLATDTGVPFTLSDSQAMAIMREPCFGCGKAGGENGNGISRLRNWAGFNDETRQAAKKGFMGPFSEANCIAACSVCNLMKGYRSIASFVEACRTIATHRGPKDYGRYPHRFRDNISKRSRSCYITKSSTHTKTHCLTNQQFNDIVAQPCAYCGKDQPNNETHYNGLDRIDSDNRVYSLDNVVSCCGDCNIMKYKHSVDFFIQHCTRVAEHHLGTVFEEETSSSTNNDNGDDPERLNKEEAKMPNRDNK